MKLVAVTVNYKTPDLTMRAVQSEIDDVSNLDGRIIVVDNDSQDGSFGTISEEVDSRGWSERVRVVKAPRNGGFGFGNNFAFRLALESDSKPSYFYLLGPDAALDPGGLTRLVEFMDANPGVGLAGSKTRNGDGSPRISAFNFPGMVSELEQGLRLGIASRALGRWTVRRPIPKTTRAVDWVSAASVLIRREVLESVGMFDESFFLYFEETDLCKRAHLAGWLTYFVVESTAMHIGQVSTGIQDLTRPRPAYWFESRRDYFLKHHGVSYLWISNLVYIFSHLLWRVRRIFQGKAKVDPPRYLRDFMRYSFWPLDARRWRVGDSSGPAGVCDVGTG